LVVNLKGEYNKEIEGNMETDKKEGDVQFDFPSVLLLLWGVLDSQVLQNSNEVSQIRDLH
jgi:hypothetical protein